MLASSQHGGHVAVGRLAYMVAPASNVSVAMPKLKLALEVLALGIMQHHLL